jgi:hypothetical protein
LFISNIDRLIKVYALLRATASTIVRNYSEEDSKANISLLTGYLHRIFQDDPDEWESILGDLFENDYFQKRFHELVQYSGVSDWSIQKVKELVDEEVLEIDVLNEFAYGGKPERISRKKFDEILGFLSKENTTESIEVALELLFFRVCMSEKEADVKTARNLLVNEKVFGRIDENRQAAIDKDRWSDLTLWYISSAEEGEEWVFLRMLFENIENCSTTGFLYFDEMIFPLLKELCGQNKHKVWNIIKEFLEFPLDIRGQILKKCISGAGSSFQNTDPLIDYLDWNDVEMWLEEGDSERAVKFVSFLPNRLFEPNDSDSILRRFLIEFGHEERVREELIGNTYNEGYTGPSSVHYQNKKDEVQEIKEKEEEYNVNRWLDELSESLDRMIEESKIREEKMDP